VERLSTVHAEQWSDLKKTKKKRRKRKKQTCGLAVLLVAMDDVAVVDCGADWLVVLLSFFAFPLCFLFLLLCSFSCSLFYSLSLSSPLKRPLVQNSTIILCFFLVPSVSQTFSPLFSLLLPPFVCLYFLISFSFMFPLKFIVFPRNPPFLFFLLFTFSISRTFISLLLHSSPLFVCPSPVFIGGQGRKPPLPSPIALNG